MSGIKASRIFFFGGSCASGSPSKPATLTLSPFGAPSGTANGSTASSELAHSTCIFGVLRPIPFGVDVICDTLLRLPAFDNASGVSHAACSKDRKQRERTETAGTNQRTGTMPSAVRYLALARYTVLRVGMNVVPTSDSKVGPPLYTRVESNRRHPQSTIMSSQVGPVAAALSHMTCMLRTIPCDMMPRILAGLRLQRTATLRPIMSASATHPTSPAPPHQ